MRPDAVVVVAPGFDDRARLRQAPEQVFVEAFIAQPAVKTFDERILYWLARLDVMPRDVIGRPCEDGTTCPYSKLSPHEFIGDFEAPAIASP